MDANFPMGDASPAQFLAVYRGEHDKTRNVLRALPPDRSDFKPHERSNDALHLAWTFPVEEKLMLMALRGEPILGSGFPKAPETWQEVLDAFDAQHEEVLRELEALGDVAPSTTATFFTAPGQTGEFPVVHFLWFLLFDQIHHRGQLSTYVRMAGGKVPSIYGPSADEPWF
jgi:uncharacterized damage-inducible protein DinB